MFCELENIHARYELVEALLVEAMGVIQALHEPDYARGETARLIERITEAIQ